MRSAYPILLNVADRLVVIVGGGAVAARKAKGLLQAGATRVRVVSPDFDPAMPQDVERVAEPYQARHLIGAGLAFAATDSAGVNEQVVREAREMGIWINRADPNEVEPGDFHVPAVFRDGPVAVAVSAGSPALSALARDHLQRHWDPRIGVMAEAMLTLRPMILSAEADPARRREMLRSLATPEALDVLRDRGADGLVRWLNARHDVGG